jgi:hypothetical protein
MKRGLIIGAIFIIMLLILIGSISSFGMHVEKIHFTISNEKIYLKRLTRGISYEVDVISHRSFTKATPDTLREYVAWRGRGFFYKIQNDSLYVFGDDWCNSSSNKIIDKVKFIPIENEILNYYNNYKKMDLIYFPPSKEFSTSTEVLQKR